MLEQKIYAVAELTRYIREVLERDTVLSNVWVRGEISNFKLHHSGHMYFTLKDDSAAIKCVMFKSRCQRLAFAPEDGLKVVARGYVSLYDRAGECQLYVEEMEPSGYGELYAAYERLKGKLAEEGLFDPEHKKPIPLLPSAVAVISSPTGAAVRDVLHVLGRRFPGIQIFFVPAVVQGDDAPPSIVKAVDIANRHGKADVILLVRGGGTIEDLWAFNTEEVARAVFSSKIPVITGVGHETDFTIVDFVADRRAPTPSAAAEMAVPEKRDLEARVERLHRALKSLAARGIEERQKKLDRLCSRRAFQNPESVFAVKVQRVDMAERRLVSSIKSGIMQRDGHFRSAAGRLEVLSPLKILARGYAICLKDEKALKDARDVLPGDVIDVILRKGGFLCRVERVRRDLAWKKRREN